MTLMPIESIEETSFSFSRDAPKPPDRRQDQRHLTILRVGTLLIEDSRELCLIRNISAGGLLAHVYSAMEPGQRVAVELKTNHQIPGEVAWVQGSNVGIAFDSPIDLVEVLANPPMLENGWRPRMPRVEIERMGILRIGADTHWVTARDISQGGVKVEPDQPLPVGATGMLELENFRPLPCLVRWQNGGLCGISFNQVIPFRELMDWLTKGR